jgi:hypothetical protein
MKTIKLAVAILALVPMLVACSNSSEEATPNAPIVVQPIAEQQTVAKPVTPPINKKPMTFDEHIADIMNVNQCLLFDQEDVQRMINPTPAQRKSDANDLKDMALLHQIAAGVVPFTDDFKKKFDMRNVHETQLTVALFDQQIKLCK